MTENEAQKGLRMVIAHMVIHFSRKPLQVMQQSLLTNDPKETGNFLL